MISSYMIINFKLLYKQSYSKNKYDKFCFEDRKTYININLSDYLIKLKESKHLLQSCF